MLDVIADDLFIVVPGNRDIHTCMGQYNIIFNIIIIIIIFMYCIQIHNITWLALNYYHYYHY